MTSIKGLAVKGRVINYYKFANEVDDSFRVADIVDSIVLMECLYTESKVELEIERWLDTSVSISPFAQSCLEHSLDCVTYDAFDCKMLVV